MPSAQSVPQALGRLREPLEGARGRARHLLRRAAASTSSGSARTGYQDLEGARRSLSGGRRGLVVTAEAVVEHRGRPMRVSAIARPPAAAPPRWWLAISSTASASRPSPGGEPSAPYGAERLPVASPTALSISATSDAAAASSPVYRCVPGPRQSGRWAAARARRRRGRAGRDAREHVPACPRRPTRRRWPPWPSTASDVLRPRSSTRSAFSACCSLGVPAVRTLGDQQCQAVEEQIEADAASSRRPGARAPDGRERPRRQVAAFRSTGDDRRAPERLQVGLARQVERRSGSRRLAASSRSGGASLPRRGEGDLGAQQVHPGALEFVQRLRPPPGQQPERRVEAPAWRLACAAASARSARRAGSSGQRRPRAPGTRPPRRARRAPAPGRPSAPARRRRPRRARAPPGRGARRGGRDRARGRWPRPGRGARSGAPASDAAR